MERIRALINKLQEQSQQNADFSALLMTVEMLRAELVHSATPPAPMQTGTSKVSVMLPSSNRISFTSMETKPETVKQRQPVEQLKAMPEPAKRVPEKELHIVELQKNDQAGWLFDPVEEIPTLVHQKEFREMNDVFGGNISSLNDKHKTEKTELASVLTDAPVRDLKKAIGINDRFVFLRELFRGDEAMYERSLKTINNFRTYSEAEYWIDRELKVKLGWDEKKEAVKHFRQLVKRRFL